jgi:radical SAM superfamily enzyme YgiQ (UPF0313 family)
MKDIVFVTFDFPRPDYPPLSYSIASILAALKANNFRYAHYSIDIRRDFKGEKWNSTLNEFVKDQLSAAVEYFKNFNYVAISVTRWSIEHTKALIVLLGNYQGKIILGGYEITAMNEASLEAEFQRVDFFLKGYAELALMKILGKQIPSGQRVVCETLDNESLHSPYLLGILNTSSRKIYWETKRGCAYRCGFCEWGNADKTLVNISLERLFSEIELFSRSCVEEINILDGVFNHGRNYLSILRQLIEKTEVKITFQARFENLFGKVSDDFLRLCCENRHRIHMEFGLQTIHEDEAEIIGRKNHIEKIKKAIKKLNDFQISYETSLIYAIPGQTVESFIDTIEFLINNGCKTIRAFPLQIPRNSMLEAKKDDYQIQLKPDKYNINSVVGSFTFSSESRRDMDNIANWLNESTFLEKINQGYDYSGLKKTGKFHFKIENIRCGIDPSNLYAQIDRNFIKATLDDINKEDKRQSVGWIGRFISFNIKKFFHHLLAGKSFMNLEDWPVEESSNPNLVQIDLKINPNLKPKKYFCEVRIGESGYLYVFRRVEVLKRNANENFKKFDTRRIFMRNRSGKLRNYKKPEL